MAIWDDIIDWIGGAISGTINFVTDFIGTLGEELAQFFTSAMNLFGDLANEITGFVTDLVQDLQEGLAELMLSGILHVMNDADGDPQERADRIVEIAESFGFSVTERERDHLVAVFSGEDPALLQEPRNFETGDLLYSEDFGWGGILIYILDLIPYIDFKDNDLSQSSTADVVDDSSGLYGWLIANRKLEVAQNEFGTLNLGATDGQEHLTWGAVINFDMTEIGEWHSSNKLLQILHGNQLLATYQLNPDVTTSSVYPLDPGAVQIDTISTSGTGASVINEYEVSIRVPGALYQDDNLSLKFWNPLDGNASKVMIIDDVNIYEALKPSLSPDGPVKDWTTNLQNVAIEAELGYAFNSFESWSVFETVLNSELSEFRDSFEQIKNSLSNANANIGSSDPGSTGLDDLSNYNLYLVADRLLLAMESYSSERNNSGYGFDQISSAMWGTLNRQANLNEMDAFLKSQAALLISGNSAGFLGGLSGVIGAFAGASSQNPLNPWSVATGLLGALSNVLSGIKNVRDLLKIGTSALEPSSIAELDDLLGAIDSSAGDGFAPALVALTDELERRENPVLSAYASALATTYAETASLALRMTLNLYAADFLHGSVIAQRNDIDPAFLTLRNLDADGFQFDVDTSGLNVTQLSRGGVEVPVVFGEVVIKPGTLGIGFDEITYSVDTAIEYEGQLDFYTTFDSLDPNKIIRWFSNKSSDLRSTPPSANLVQNSIVEETLGDAVFEKHDMSNALLLDVLEGGDATDDLFEFDSWNRDGRQEAHGFGGDDVYVIDERDGKAAIRSDGAGEGYDQIIFRDLNVEDVTVEEVTVYGGFDPVTAGKLSDSGGTNANDIRAVDLVTLANGNLIMLTAERNSSDEGLASFRIYNNPDSSSYGQIIGGRIDQEQARYEGDGYRDIEDLAAVTLANGSTFVYSADPEGNAIGITRVNADGSLDDLRELRDGSSNNLFDDVQELEIAQVGSRNFLVSLGGGSDGGINDALVVHQINNDGSLSQRDIERDGSGWGENYLNNGNPTDASLLETFTDSRGNTFVVAGGSENGLSLWTMNASGGLSFQNARGDDQAGGYDRDPQGNLLSRDEISPSGTGLWGVDAGAFAEIDGEVYLFVGGRDNAIVTFRVDNDVRNDGTFDLTLVGQVIDPLQSISSMAFMHTDDGARLAVGGESSGLRFFDVAVNADGTVNVELSKTLEEGDNTEFADSEALAFEAGILVSASDDDDGVAIIDTGLYANPVSSGLRVTSQGGLDLLIDAEIEQFVFADGQVVNASDFLL